MENILLTFLSDVKFIGGKPTSTPYKIVDGKPCISGENAETTNESAIRYLLQYDLKDTQLSKIFIFASKTVRSDIVDNTEKKYYDEDGNTVTHLEYFKRRMKKFMPNVDECITDETIYPYEETGDIEKNLRSVAEMAERIQNYAKGKDIRLYADLTGGMRNINMMMLDVIRLLEYSGVKIEKLIYSNSKNKIVDGKTIKEREIEVEELNDTYDLFQLISGVEEFVNFGSVEALNKYYAANADKFKKSNALQKLTDAMENFAKSIKLCRFGQFKAAIQKLHNAISAFNMDSKNLHDVFMARLIEKIRDQYWELLKTRGENDLEIIRWCIDHDYLQQALTLYTERVPEFLGENGFLILSDKNKKKLENMVENDRRAQYYYLFNVYKPDDPAFKNLKKYLNAIKNAIYWKGNFNLDYNSWYRENLAPLEKIQLTCKDAPLLRSQLTLLHELRKNPKPLLNLDDAKLEPIRQILNELSEKFLTLHNEFARRKVLFSFINEIQFHDTIKYFPPLQFAADVYATYSHEKIKRVYETIYNKFFEPAIPVDKFLSIMEKYYELQDERNNSNHANKTAKFNTADELEKFMRDALNEIEDAFNTLSR